jgi:hypothetical protein
METKDTVRLGEIRRTKDGKCYLSVYWMGDRSVVGAGLTYVKAGDQWVDSKFARKFSLNDWSEMELLHSRTS